MDFSDMTILRNVFQYLVVDGTDGRCGYPWADVQY